MRITCPHCHFSRDVHAEQLPRRAVFATCPKCQLRFKFRVSLRENPVAQKTAPSGKDIPGIIDNYNTSDSYLKEQVFDASVNRPAKKREDQPVSKAKSQIAQKSAPVEQVKEKKSEIEELVSGDGLEELLEELGQLEREKPSPLPGAIDQEESLEEGQSFKESVSIEEVTEEIVEDSLKISESHAQPPLESSKLQKVRDLELANGSKKDPLPEGKNNGSKKDSLPEDKNNKTSLTNKGKFNVVYPSSNGRRVVLPPPKRDEESSAMKREDADQIAAADVRKAPPPELSLDIKDEPELKETADDLNKSLKLEEPQGEEIVADTFAKVTTFTPEAETASQETTKETASGAEKGNEIEKEDLDKELWSSSARASEPVSAPDEKSSEENFAELDSFAKNIAAEKDLFPGDYQEEIEKDEKTEKEPRDPLFKASRLKDFMEPDLPLDELKVPPPPKRESVSDIWAKLQAMDEDSEGEEDGNELYKKSKYREEYGIPSGPRVEIPWEDKDNFSVLSGLFVTIGRVLTSPIDFFELIPVNRPYFRSIVFFFLIIVILTLAYLLTSYIGFDGPDHGTAMGEMETFLAAEIPYAIFFLPLAFLVWLLFHACLVYVFLVIFKARAPSPEGLSQTLRILAYTSPVFLVMAIPLPAILIFPIIIVWSITIQVIGMQKTSRGGYTENMAAVFATWTIYFVAIVAATRGMILAP